MIGLPYLSEALNYLYLCIFLVYQARVFLCYTKRTTTMMSKHTTHICIYVVIKREIDQASFSLKAYT